MKLDIKIDATLDEEEIVDISFVSVVDAVCEVMLLPRELLMSRSRPAYLCNARFITYYLGWLLTKRSLPSLGRFMGRDHTTVLYGRDKCIKMMRENKDFRETVDKVKEVAYENEARQRQSAQLQLAEIKEEVERAAREASKRVATKGVLSGEKVVFNSVYPE
jgi:hypothetical protein